jgi:hypothetical protein
MAAHDIPERYGVHPVRVVRHQIVGLAGKPPLTEGQIRENQASERNTQL